LVYQFAGLPVNFRQLISGVKINLRLWLAILLCFAAIGRNSHAGELNIAAASDLKFALDKLSRQFETNTPGVQIKISYGSSGNFYAQIQNQAPFDLFFSADIQYPQKLIEAGFASPTNLFRYAVGRIVLWVPKQSTIDLEKLGINALLDPSVRKIAIANPQHAPYGRAAVAAMQSTKIFSQIKSRLVYGENIAQTAQFVQTGAADIGIIALSLALAPPMKDAGRFWELPIGTYPKLEQAGIVLNSVKDTRTALAFRDFVSSDAARAVLARYGFVAPEK
jgi:molybdate transport system substrate-binding protein